MVLVWQLIWLVRPGTAAAVSPALLISSLQTSSTASASDEFVVLTNAGAEAVDLAGWQVAYLTAKTLAATTLVTLEGSLKPGATIPLAHEGFGPEATQHFSKGMDDAGGHVRIQDETGTIMDTLGWGTAIQPEGAAAGALSPTTVLKRQIDADGQMLDSDNNSADFVLTQQNAIKEPAEAPENSCDGIVLSELLPNPSGTDTGHEFVELHNTTANTISLTGCSLQVAGSTKVFTFPANTAMQAGEYHAFFDTQTGLVLPNAAGGTVVLADQVSEQTVVYPGNLASDEAWIDTSGHWQITGLPSPNQPNVLRVDAVEDTDTDADDVVAPCPEGKYRNPETNRCKSMTAVALLAVCAAGQERNPETNRCRSLGTSVGLMASCKPGQERNSDTNRCRSVLTASTVTAPKPCQPGQERSPETNRCKKVSGAPTAHSAPEQPGPSKVSYAVVAFSVMGGLGYGIYEYKDDLRYRFAALRTRVAARIGGS